MGEVLDTDPQLRPSQKLFTVGIPVFNGRSMLRNCLESVLNSTLPRDHYEIMIADDGSTEPETLAILAEYERTLAGDPGLFRVISLGANSGGAARPRNRILEEANGEYVFFVDSDDTIGNLALQRIADQLATKPVDWVALNQVPVNGRAAVCTVRQTHVEVPRRRALSTLTVHKVFRRAEIERQQLRFDEQLPSGQDIAFAFSYIVNAQSFVMLGGYDYYYLTQHRGNPREPAHLSMSANFPLGRIQKNERILYSMLQTLGECELSESELQEILSGVVLYRVLVSQKYLVSIIDAGPSEGLRALRRLAELLTDPVAAGLDRTSVKGLTEEHFAAIAACDWAGLKALVDVAAPQAPSIVRNHWFALARRVVNVVSGRARHRQVVNELALLRRSVEAIRHDQQRLEGMLQEDRQARRAEAAGSVR